MDKHENKERISSLEKGDENMNAIATKNEKYNPLDLKILRSKKSSTISYEESLKDVEPIDWSDKVLSGKKKKLKFSGNFPIKAEDKNVTNSKRNVWIYKG